ncbi:MAG: hypothetical protein OEY19_12820 [Gammaproteobacteria bacterium]|nr:hypothetical protein [Gammaproteobacteria bacterium]MDH5631250.1 hypothetical protein [Gammaproteobacteria bacterium]
MNNVLIATLPLLGVVIGALLQFILGRSSEKRKQLEVLRSEAYSTYLRSVSASAHMQSEKDRSDVFKLASDAKSRIAVYGSASVIEALAKFEEAGAVLNNENSIERFISIVKAMRSDNSPMSDKNLSLVLFGTAQQGTSVDAKNRRD